MISKDKKIAIVLFNLGGPLKRQDIRPFLYNLFSDKNIIRLPFFLRKPLAWWIAKTRAPLAAENYDYMGGGSPLLANTQAQADALEQRIQKTYPRAKVFIAMRYWHPRANATLDAINAYGAEEIVLLPLYPHYSTTTTESSLEEWRAVTKKDTRTTHPVCCWWNEPDFIEAHAKIIRAALEQNQDKNYHLLFSAHGVPENIIKGGDPYQKHIEGSAALIAEAAGLNKTAWSLAYQSRVGRLKWLEPETGSELVRLAQVEKKSTIFVVPISFVSEHIETLVELDIEYKELALKAGLRHYIRLPTLSCDEGFIALLEKLIDRSLAQESLLCPDEQPCTETY